MKDCEISDAILAYLNYDSVSEYVRTTKQIMDEAKFSEKPSYQRLHQLAKEMVKDCK